VVLQFDMLGSGSSGNCGLMQTQDAAFLIDAGFSSKRIGEMLARRNVSPEQIEAIFITHEHTDHIQGLRGLRKYKNIKFFANKNTAEVIEQKFSFDIAWQTFSTGEKFNLGNLSISSFSVPHDAADPIGYVFSFIGNGEGTIRSIAWMTDLGYIPSHVIKNVADVNLLIIESNYDNKLLALDRKRPPYIKARIRSRYGHLSNEAAVNFIKSSGSNQWKKIVFAHVSADCNSESSIKELLEKSDMPNFEIDIARA
jgi:phosphoribosyl 1,2-cyclic phosphodiesterase